MAATRPYDYNTRYSDVSTGFSSEAAKALRGLLWRINVGSHRILFRIIGDTLPILPVRHCAQAMLKPGELN